MSTPLLQVKNLCTSFDVDAGEVRAVNGISFSLDKGKVLGIVGESGSGKSVTAYSIMRILVEPGRIKSGEILFDGQDIVKFSKKQMSEFRGKRVSIIFQDPMTSLNPTYTIGNQLREAILLHTNRNHEQANARAVEMLKLVGVNEPEKRLKQYPHELSGGQLQRISILRSMLLKPKFLVVDEPVSMLDVSVRADIINMLLKLVENHNTSILFISHDISIIRYVSARVAVMYLGNIVEMGETDTIIHHPLHPYTQALISNCASIDLDEKREPIRIEGEPPSPVDPKPCCPFAGRCFCEQEICWREKPQLRHMADGRVVACHLVKEK